VVEYLELKIKTMDSINSILNNANSILVTSHLQPDPDAICSALAMYEFLKHKYPKAKVTPFLSGEPMQNYQTLKGYSDIQWVNEITEHFNNYELIVLVDQSAPNMFTTNTAEFNKSLPKMICIDHHDNPVPEFAAKYIEKDASSCSEVIYREFFRNDPTLVSADLCEIILTGIFGDTGSMKYINGTNSIVLDTIKELLIKSNLTVQDIQRKYFGYTNSDLLVIGQLLQNLKKVDDFTYPYIYSYLNPNILNLVSFQDIKSATSKFMFLFSGLIKGYDWGFVLMPEEKDLYRLSFRSIIGSVNVRMLTTEYFNGGGHDVTSGGKFESIQDEPVEDVCARIISIIKSADIKKI